MRIWSWALALLTLLPIIAVAQESTSQKRLLEARRRQIDLERSQEEVERVEQLFAQGVVSQTEVARTRSDRDKNRLAFEEALLDLLSVRPRLSVRQAIKHQEGGGQPSVRLELTNLTPAIAGAELELLQQLGSGGSLPESLADPTIRDVFVSLRDTGAAAPGNPSPMRGATIALPYERAIPEIAHGQSVSLEFALLRDVSSVLVHLSFAGQSQEIDLHLEQEESARSIRLTSTRASQEADLGGEAIYDLRLSRASVDVRSFRLGVVNLPRSIPFSFVDPATEARLAQVSFPAGVSERQLELRLFLPERATPEMPLDQPLELWVVATSDQQSDPFAESRRYAPEEITSSEAGAARLAITPRGVGRLELAAISFFAEIHGGEAADIEVQVRNVGSRHVDQVSLEAQGPVGWRIDVDPPTIAVLEAGREEVVSLTVKPPTEVVVGEYELDLQARGSAFAQQIESAEKTYRVSIAARPRILATALLLAVFLAIVAGVVIFGLRLTRR